MAIFKAINSKGTTTHGALRNCLQYVMQPSKTDNETLCFFIGPFGSDYITPDSAYRAFLDIKNDWEKDEGRMYMHYVLSFPKSDPITPEGALDFGIEFAAKAFAGYQCVLAVHSDKEHLHCHFVVNTVSYVDGKKIQKSRKDLKMDKELCNTMCIDYGLSVAQKGKHADGTDMEEGTVIAWAKDKYHAIINAKKPSYLVDCGIAVIESLKKARSKETFIKAMESRGWQVDWKDKKKHIVFINSDGKKVRDSNLYKSFNIAITKEVFEHEHKEYNERSPKRKRSRGQHI